MLSLIELKDVDGLIFYVVVRICITLACWFFMICANLIDFWSGTSTAKALGEKLYSHGFRRTVVKIGDYWRIMLFALMFDVLGSFLSFYVLPFITVLCTAAIIWIEGRSVQENNARKKANAAEIPELVRQIITATTEEQGLAILKKIIDKTETKHEKN